MYMGTLMIYAGSGSFTGSEIAGRARRFIRRRLMRGPLGAPNERVRQPFGEMHHTVRIRFEHIPNLLWILPLSMSTRLVAIILKHPGFPPGWGGEMPAVAHAIATGNGFASPYLIETGPTALVPPVYPYLLAILFKLFGPHSMTAGLVALGLNTVLSTLVVIPLFILTRKLFNRRAALVAVWVWAILPIAGYTDALFIWNTSLYTLTLTTFLAVTLSLEGDDFRKLWALYGVLAGFMIVVEPISLTVVGLSCLWLIYRRIPAKTLILILAITSLLPFIWIARNFLTFRQPVFIRSGFGLELSRGIRDNELVGERGRSLPNRNPEELEKYKQMGELGYIQSRSDEAINWIREHPAEYGVKVVQRAIAFWTGYRVSQIYLFYGRFELIKRLFFALPALGAFLSLFFLRNKAFPFIFAILLLYPIVFFITHVELRQRLPIEPLLIGLTVGAIYSWRQICKRYV
jgi:Dolichyl-phosphate-mannose-protein mannosyltransferase